jgi:hypothetical protein
VTKNMALRLAQRVGALPMKDLNPLHLAGMIMKPSSSSAIDIFLYTRDGQKLALIKVFVFLKLDASQREIFAS